MRKHVLCHMRTIKAQVSLSIRAVSVTKISSLMLVSIPEQVSLSLAWSETPEDTFSHDKAHFVQRSE